MSSICGRALLAAIVLLISAPSAFAASKGKPCPIVVNKATGEYQALNRTDYVCYKRASDARRAGFVNGEALGPAESVQQNFSLQGVGDAFSPLFRVGSKPAVVTYSFTGPGTFTIELIDYKTRRIASRIVRVSGRAGATSYLNVRGTYYLAIYGSTTSSTKDPDPAWDVDLHIAP